MSRAWMPLYIADYLADTAHLNNAATGSYLLLIMHYWVHGLLPDDDKLLRRIARCEARWWPQIKNELKPFFYDGWKHKRIDQELEKANEISNKRGEAAAQRWSKRTPIAHANGYAHHMPRARASQSQSHKEDSYLIEKGKKKANGQVFVKEDTPQWKAWVEHYRKSSDTGTGPPKAYSDEDRTAVGWWFPTEWPPESQPPPRSN